MGFWDRNPQYASTRPTRLLAEQKEWLASSGTPFEILDVEATSFEYQGQERNVWELVVAVPDLGEFSLSLSRNEGRDPQLSAMKADLEEFGEPISARLVKGKSKNGNAVWYLNPA